MPLAFLPKKDKISEVLILLRASFCILRTFFLHIFFFDQVFFFFSRQLFDRIFPLHCFLFSLKFLIIDQCDLFSLSGVFFLFRRSWLFPCFSPSPLSRQLLLSVLPVKIRSFFFCQPLRLLPAPAVDVFMMSRNQHVRAVGLSRSSLGQQLIA